MKIPFSPAIAVFSLLAACGAPGHPDADNAQADHKAMMAADSAQKATLTAREEGARGAAGLAAARAGRQPRVLPGAPNPRDGVALIAALARPVTRAGVAPAPHWPLSMRRTCSRTTSGGQAPMNQRLATHSTTASSAKPSSASQ